MSKRMKIISSSRSREFSFLPHSVPFNWVEEHERQAQKNHSQSLDRLNERGGLSPNELLAIMLDMDFYALYDGKTQEYVTARIVRVFARLETPDSDTEEA